MSSFGCVARTLYMYMFLCVSLCVCLKKKKYSEAQWSTQKHCYPWDSALEQRGLRQFHMQKITLAFLQHPLYSDTHNSANGLPDSKLLHAQIWSFLPSCNLESSWNYKPSSKPFYSPKPNIQTSVGPIEFSELSGFLGKVSFSSCNSLLLLLGWWKR